MTHAGGTELIHSVTFHASPLLAAVSGGITSQCKLKRGGGGAKTPPPHVPATAASGPLLSLCIAEPW